jgi:tetratricopeptide (TPR) repeat protein
MCAAIISERIPISLPRTTISGVGVGDSKLCAVCAVLFFTLFAAVPTTALAQGYAGSADDTNARALAQSRGADEVYKFLAPLENQYAGDADFDYALGTAALDSGRQSHAVFVLQRAVAARPQFAGARMDLARAYFTIGDNESARREFAILEKDNPPPQARRAIAEYQAAIDRRASAYRRQRSAWAELGTGFDSNANGAPDIQDFVGIPLDSRNQSTSSPYYNLGVGGLVSQPIAPGWRLVGNGSAAYRGNPDASFVDSQTLRLSGGLDWRTGKAELSLQPNFAMAMLDGEDNHQVVGLDLAGTWYATGRTQASFIVRNSQTRYAEGLEVLDVDTTMLGVSAQYAMTGMPRVQWVGALTFGGDDAVEPGSPYGRDLFGARAGAIVDFGSGHAMLASLATLTADYDGVFFGDTREDDQLGASLGYEWGGLRARGWTVRAQLNYVDNSSTVALYDYDRVDAGVSLRKEFK